MTDCDLTFFNAIICFYDHKPVCLHQNSMPKRYENFSQSINDSLEEDDDMVNPSKFIQRTINLSKHL